MNIQIPAARFQPMKMVSKYFKTKIFNREEEKNIQRILYNHFQKNVMLKWKKHNFLLHWYLISNIVHCSLVANKVNIGNRSSAQLNVPRVDRKIICMYLDLAIMSRFLKQRYRDSKHLLKPFPSNILVKHRVKITYLYMHEIV